MREERNIGVIGVEDEGVRWGGCRSMDRRTRTTAGGGSGTMKERGQP